MRSNSRRHSVFSGLETLEGRKLLDAALPFEVYFPEGFAGASVDASVPIQNPGDVATQYELWARYEKGEAEHLLSRSTVPGRGNAEVMVSQAGGSVAPGLRRDEPFAYVLKSAQPLTATLRHDDFGNHLLEQFTSQTASRWAFAEARRGDDSVDFILVYNPGPNAVDATLTLYGEHGAVITSTIHLEAQRRGGWSIKDLVGVSSGEFAAEVTATGDIVASQSQYGLHASKPHGFSQLGTPGAGATSGFVPALELDDDFYSRRNDDRGTDIPSIVRPDLAVSVFNGDASAAANVTLTFVFDDSGVASVTRTVSVDAGRRTQFSMADLNLPVDSKFGVLYTSDLPVTVAASVFQGNSLVGVEASTQAATNWSFGNGSMDVQAFGRGLREDVYLFNPSGTEVTISIDLIRPNGSVTTLTKRVGAHELEDVDFRSLTELVSRQDQTPFMVQVRSSVPIVASFERRDPFHGVDFSILGTPSGTVVAFGDAWENIVPGVGDDGPGHL